MRKGKVLSLAAVVAFVFLLAGSLVLLTPSQGLAAPNDKAMKAIKVQKRIALNCSTTLCCKEQNQLNNANKEKKQEKEQEKAKKQEKKQERKNQKEQEKANKPPVIPKAKFGGIWTTSLGEMKLVQTGNKVTGTFSEGNGEIRGEVRGHVLVGMWIKPSSEDGVSKDFGDIMLYISNDYLSLRGKWRDGSRGPWNHQFTGVKNTEEQPPVVVPIWSGTFKTTWGVMKLTQDGNKVVGTYVYGSGKITGTVSGNTLTGRWSIAPSYKAPIDAGDLQLTISADGRTLTGKWRNGSTGEWNTNWTGTRVPPAVPLTWSGTFKTTWGEMKLTQDGNKVMGTYVYGSGKITGTVSGNTLTGRWSIAPSYKAPTDAGDLQLTVSADGKTLTGKWRNGSTGEWNTNWTGTRVSPVVSLKWDGNWSSSWGDMTLIQINDEVAGTYTYKSGTLQGTVSGNVLTGTWVIDDPTTSTNCTGDLELTMGTDGKSFTGKWRYGTSGEWCEGPNGTLK